MVGNSRLKMASPDWAQGSRQLAAASNDSSSPVDTSLTKTRTHCPTENGAVLLTCDRAGLAGRTQAALGWQPGKPCKHPPGPGGHPLLAASAQHADGGSRSSSSGAAQAPRAAHRDAVAAGWQGARHAGQARVSVGGAGGAALEQDEGAAKGPGRRDFAVLVDGPRPLVEVGQRDRDADGRRVALGREDQQGVRSWPGKVPHTSSEQASMLTPAPRSTTLDRLISILSLRMYVPAGKKTTPAAAELDVAWATAACNVGRGRLRGAADERGKVRHVPAQPALMAAVSSVTLSPLAPKSVFTL